MTEGFLLLCYALSTGHISNLIARKLTLQLRLMDYVTG